MAVAIPGLSKMDADTIRPFDASLGLSSDGVALAPLGPQRDDFTPCSGEEGDAAVRRAYREEAARERI